MYLDIPYKIQYDTNRFDFKSIIEEVLLEGEKVNLDEIHKLKEYQSNAKMCWKIFNEVMNRKRKPQPKPILVIKDNKEIKGKSNIANEFNKFFANIGP